MSQVVALDESGLHERDGCAFPDLHVPESCAFPVVARDESGLHVSEACAVPAVHAHASHENFLDGLVGYVAVKRNW